jgi:hypothetical protein
MCENMKAVYAAKYKVNTYNQNESINGRGMRYNSNSQRNKS